MARTTLAERMIRLDQQKARIAEQEAKLKSDERRQRTRRLIEAGGMIEKAGLFDLDANALYGALLSLGVSAKNANQIDAWAKAGETAVTPSRLRPPDAPTSDEPAAKAADAI